MIHDDSKLFVMLLHISRKILLCKIIIIIIFRLLLKKSNKRLFDDANGLLFLANTKSP